jgi:hypothetical protein
MRSRSADARGCDPGAGGNKSSDERPLSTKSHRDRQAPRKRTRRSAQREQAVTDGRELLGVLRERADGKWRVIIDGLDVGFCGTREAALAFLNKGGRR